MKTRGRRTKLNGKLQNQICKLLSQGHTIATVCDAVGIAERTYYDWCEKYLHFSQAATCAIGQSKIFLVDKLRRADDWRAQAFLLERRWPDDFGRSVGRPLPPPPAEPPSDLSDSVKLVIPDDLVHRMLDDNARVMKALNKLPVGAGIHPRTGVITLADGTVISPDDSRPCPETSQEAEA